MIGLEYLKIDFTCKRDKINANLLYLLISWLWLIWQKNSNLTGSPNIYLFTFLMESSPLPTEAGFNEILKRMASSSQVCSTSCSFVNHCINLCHDPQFLKRVCLDDKDDGRVWRFLKRCRDRTVADALTREGIAILLWPIWFWRHSDRMMSI